MSLPRHRFQVNFLRGIKRIIRLPHNAPFAMHRIFKINFFVLNFTSNGSSDLFALLFDYSECISLSIWSDHRIDYTAEIPAIYIQLIKSAAVERKTSADAARKGKQAQKATAKNTHKAAE